MSRKIIIIFLFCALPLFTLLLTAVYHFSPYYQNINFTGTFPPLLTAFAGLTAVYALALLVLMLIQNIHNKQLHQKIKSLENVNTELIKQAGETQSKLDLLSATREISLLLNEEVESKAILKKALEIIAQLSNPQREAEEVTIFLKSEDGGQFIPVIQRKGGKTLFANQFKDKPVDRTNVRESAEHQRLLLSVNGEEFDFTLPLVADREVVGVIKVKTTIESETSLRSEKTRHLQNNLMEFAKIIALTIKTPALYNQTITDPLTGLFSKRHLFAQLQIYFELARKYQEPLSLVMIDLDHFKNINDTYGHPVGDLVLKETADLISENIRKTSSAYRYGGEEIAIILPGADKEAVLALAERLRRKVEHHQFSSSEGKIKITLSLGVAIYEAQMDNFQEILTRADNALYQAKQTGRNRVCVY